MQNFKAYEQRMDSGAVQVALEGAGAQIFIAPGSGFKLYSAIYENRQMLMPTDEPLQGSAANGVPILFPFPNRTRDCKYTYGGHTCEPVRDNLPERCYSVLSGSDEIIIIKRGEKGYFKTDIPVTDKDEARSIANEYNAKLGVSRAQEEAMKAGSMFGFQVPAADPRNYDADGKPVMPKDRGDAR